MKKLLLLLLLLASPAFGQTVQQFGNVTHGHVPYWTTSGVIADGGSSSDSPITSFGVTNSGGAGICVSSDRQSASGRNQLCFGAQTSGAATISLQNYGTALPQALNFIVNGVTTVFPTPATPLAVSSGGTGATTAASARANLGLGTIATQNANAVAITGGTITGLPSPSNPTDAAIKSYVDAVATGLNLLAPSTLATAAVLPNTPTYSNGTLGVGATLTAGSNSTLTVDGTVANLNDVILVQNQASAFQNGIYKVTTAGDGGTEWVLTRATYFDQTAEMKAGSYTFITAGVSNINTSWTLQAAVPTVGTSAVTFVQFSSTESTLPGGSSGQVQFNNSGAFGGFTASGDATINTSTGGVTLATVNSNIGTFAGLCLQLTANGKGLLTAILNGICGINAQTGNYPIATSDCGKIVTESGGPFTVTLPAASGFTAGCKVTICNINPNDASHHAVLLSGFPNPFFPRLYMMQCGDVVNIAATSWQPSYFPGRFHPNFSPTWLVDTGGSDNNDGLISNASGNALLTLGGCTHMMQVEYDISGNIQPTCSPTAGQTFSGSFAIVGPLVGNNVFNISGNGGVATLRPTPTTGGFVLQLSDFAPYMISTNITWDCTGGTAGCASISFHQQTGADLNSGTTLQGNAVGHIGVSCDSMCKINVGANPLNATGAFSSIATLDEGSVINFNSGVTIAGSSDIPGSLVVAAHNSNVAFAGALIAGTGISIGEIFTLRTGATGCINANFTTSGSFGGARQWSVLNNAFFGNASSTAIPGSTPGINTLSTFANGVVANSGINSGGC